MKHQQELLLDYRQILADLTWQHSSTHHSVRRLLPQQRASLTAITSLCYNSHCSRALYGSRIASTVNKVYGILTGIQLLSQALPHQQLCSLQTGSLLLCKPRYRTIQCLTSFHGQASETAPFPFYHYLTSCGHRGHGASWHVSTLRTTWKTRLREFGSMVKIRMIPEAGNLDRLHLRDGGSCSTIPSSTQVIDGVGRGGHHHCFVVMARILVRTRVPLHHQP